MKNSNITDNVQPVEQSMDWEESQKLVNQYFDSESVFWKEIYQDKNNVYSVIHQQRQEITLHFFDGLNLSKDSRILEIGCGAGLITTAIARRGYKIEALDSVQAMIDLTKKHAKELNLEHLIEAKVSDINALPYPDNSLDAIITLGVLPWLPDVKTPLREMSRILKPGGYIILNVDNRYRLNHLVNPFRMPALEKPKFVLIRLLEKSGLRKSSHSPRPKLYRIKEFIEHLDSVNLNVIRQKMFGFGPFGFMRMELFPGSGGVKVHHFLQRYADRGFPILRSTGAQTVFLARKD